MRKTKKTKAQKIQEAVDALNKAMELDEPDIKISLPIGMDKSQEFLLAKALFRRIRSFTD